MVTLNYPLEFHPMLHPAVWGGSRLVSKWGKNPPPPDNLLIGESWEISDFEPDVSIVSSGALAGKSIHELMKAHEPELIGHDWFGKFAHFPLIIKFIDAAKNLSVQVHPDKRSTIKFGGYAKEEAWYIIDSESDSKITLGFKPGTTRKKFESSLEDETFEKHLNEIVVSSSQFYDIPPKTVHSIGAGCFIYEVQERSDTTYRIYDWGRGRDLHVDEAMDMISFEPIKPRRPFVVGEHHITGQETFKTLKKSFHIISVIDGMCVIDYKIGTLPLWLGKTALIPAYLEEYTIVASPTCKILTTKLPEVG